MYYNDVHDVVILCVCTCASGTVIKLTILSSSYIVIVDKNCQILRSRHTGMAKLEAEMEEVSRIDCMSDLRLTVKGCTNTFFSVVIILYRIDSV